MPIPKTTTTTKNLEVALSPWTIEHVWWAGLDSPSDNLLDFVLEFPQMKLRALLAVLLPCWLSPHLNRFPQKHSLIIHFAHKSSSQSVSGKPDS